MKREPNTQYILSLSYGKDSIACLKAIEELGWPLDRIIHAEVWATDTIQADLPPMVEFKAKADKIIKERWGIEVEHLCATRNGEKLTYEKLFYHIPKRKDPARENGDWGGEPKGWPLTIRSWCKDLKTERSMWLPLHSQLVVQETQRRVLSSASLSSRETGVPAISNGAFSRSSLAQGAKTNIVQYLGIAADEPKRIERHNKPGFLMPLVEIGWDEAYCRKWCEENDLLSPIYTSATRGGCWFCHNQGVDQLRLLRKSYPDLWELLLKWDLDSPTSFKADGHTVHDYDLRFSLEDEGKVPADRKFRWKMLNIEEENNMATKKEETQVDYSTMNALRKLQIARVKFLNAGVKKSGKNISLEFKYFELADIVPIAENIFGEVGLLMVPTFGKEYATARVYNCDDRDEEPVVFEAPFTQIAPIISNSGKAVTNEMQALGSSITYMRRYLWQLILDIIESDTIDSLPGSNDDAPTPTPAPKTRKAPATAAQRKEIKEELTNPDAPADELQITALKTALKNLMEIDPEQESFVQSVAVKTEGFTNLSKNVCEQLINGVNDMLTGYETQEG